MAQKHHITVADLLPPGEYAKVRVESRRRIAARKRNRRVEVGPFVTFYFEDFETIWLQIQEMIHIEKGTLEQAPSEIAAYAPLIPKGRELVATFMIEIDDPLRRKRVLDTLGTIEETAFIELDGERIVGVAEADQDRTRADGKASAVQFVHFPFTDAQVAAFREPGARALIGFTHQNYGHIAVMPEAVRAELAGDFA
ncbi:DUF3501 family protein [Methylosinus sporium]|uniref:DUF3501 domain-containing protein n=1 Tax=Methylosinus sporium TaxID=428 RepID=A0A2U1SRP3_METSR|nr:DUF3501 family protein [Methylosinus sporium]PWB94294.1 DUF3501 domain-containing protein [Methylosinus sporium]